jgi:hypothetical protein
MRQSLDQQTINEKIHKFIARKSQPKSFSDVIAERLVPIETKKRRTGISYEPMQWHQG